NPLPSSSLARSVRPDLSVQDPFCLSICTPAVQQKRYRGNRKRADDQAVLPANAYANLAALPHLFD
ncbi:MAG: hypothetical protein ACK2T3_06555, partial [Candidatus Promineifilaceae bacterium]